jgi:tRNA U34 5-carboxymethylaminomethyl modifying enzyme MnmG/GidA
LADGRRIATDAVILTTGTFLPSPSSLFAPSHFSHVQL